MPKYRKKPVEVEAVQWFKVGDHAEVEMAMSPALSCRCGFCNRLTMDHGAVRCSANERNKICPGDWIVTNGEGEITILNSNDFKDAFEPVEEGDH